MSCWGLLLLGLAGCVFEPPPAEVLAVPVRAPVLTSMAASQIRVGEVLAFSGDDFVPPEIGVVEVTFDGMFLADGAPVPVETTLTAARTEIRRIETPFGPIDIPFTEAGNVAGVFRGRVRARNVAFDGRVAEQEPPAGVEVELTVLPSLVVRGLEAKLQHVALTPPDALAGTPYRLTIEAVGFSLASIEYHFGGGVRIDGAHVDRVIHDALGATDALGDRELLEFAPEYDEDVAAIVIDASSEDGETHVFPLNVIVHQ